MPSTSSGSALPNASRGRPKRGSSSSRGEGGRAVDQMTPRAATARASVMSRSADARHIAPRDARHLDVADAPQLGHRLGFGLGREIEAGGERLARERRGVGETCGELVREAPQYAEHEIADDAHATRRRGEVSGQRDVDLGRLLRDAIESRLQRCREIRRPNELHSERFRCIAVRTLSAKVARRKGGFPQKKKPRTGGASARTRNAETGDYIIPSMPP